MIGASGFLPPVVVEVTASIAQLKTQLDAARREVHGLEASTVESSKRMGMATKMAFVAVAAGVGAIVKIGIDEAREAEQVNAKFAASIKALGQNMEVIRPNVEALGESMVKLGFDDEDATLAFMKLNTALQDPTKAMKLMGVTADFAAIKGMSLEAAASTMARASQGSARAFKEFGISMDMSIKDPTERADAAMKLLGERLAGQAAAKADTFDGKMAVLKETVNNLAQSLGETFIPVIKNLADILIVGADFLKNYGKQILYVTGVAATMFLTFKVGAIVMAGYRTLMGLVAVQQALAAASGIVLSTAQGIATVATMGLTAAMNALKAAFLSNPIGLIAMAFVALVAALVYAWNNFEWFRKGIAMAAAFIIEKMALLGDKILGFFKFVSDYAFAYVGNFLSIMESMFGWVPGLGDQISSAKSAVNSIGKIVGATLDGWGDSLRNSAKKLGASAYESIMEGFGEQPADELPALPGGKKKPLEKVAGAAGKAVSDAMKEKIAEAMAAMALYREQFKSAQQLVAGDLYKMNELAMGALAKAKAFMTEANADERRTKGTKNHAAAMKELTTATKLYAEAQKYQIDVQKEMQRAAEEAARSVNNLTDSYARNNSYLAAQSRVSGFEQRGSYVEVPVVIDGQVLFRVTQKASLLNNRRNSANGLAVSGSVI
jgi:hypothetical protein